MTNNVSAKKEKTGNNFFYSEWIFENTQIFPIKLWLYPRFFQMKHFVSPVTIFPPSPTIVRKCQSVQEDKKGEGTEEPTEGRQTFSMQKK